MYKCIYSIPFVIMANLHEIQLYLRPNELGQQMGKAVRTLTLIAT